MNKIEIKQKLEEILNDKNFSERIGEGKNIIRKFWDLYNSEQNESDDPDESDHEPTTEQAGEEESLNDEIKALIDQFKAKRDQLEKAAAEEEKKNLEIKKGLISRLRNLIQHEENIGTLFNEIKEIQNGWKEIGNIPRKVAQEINQEYHNLNEQFYYNINIYKELKEHDLKKNYSLKNQIVHQMKDLLKEDQISEVQEKLRLLQDEWAEIGPTYQEHWDKLKEDYYSTQNEVYEKIRSFYENRKQEQEKNLELKTELLARAKEIAGGENTDVKQWERTTKKLLELQEDWKKIGFGPAKENKEIWREFRSVYNDFFDRKGEFFKGQNEVYDKNGRRKEQLIEKAIAAKDSDDFKAATQQILNLQKQWKKIGHAGKYSEQKLWKKFRSACDEFFDKKESHFKQRDAENAANLASKEALIKEIEAFKPEDDKKVSIAALKEFSRRFAEIGNVPYSEKDKINKAYKSAIDAHYASLDMSNSEKEKVLFEARLEQILASSNPGRMIRAEKDRIRKRITQLTGEINQYENNLGFFKNSKGAEALLGDVNTKIDKAREQIDRLKKQLRQIPKEKEA